MFTNYLEIAIIPIKRAILRKIIYTFRSPDIVGASYTSSWQDHPYFVESGNKVDVSDTFNDIDRKCNGDLSRYACVVWEQ